jgi:hypothetical protein
MLTTFKRDETSPDFDGTKVFSMEKIKEVLLNI